MAPDGWDSEEIPDEDSVLRRVHQNHIQDGEVSPAAFVAKDQLLSTNWRKYSSAEQARLRARIPAKNGVVSFKAGRLRRIGQTVRHSPDWELQDRSHTDVGGPKSPEVRLKMVDMLEWCIRPEDPISG